MKTVQAHELKVGDLLLAETSLGKEEVEVIEIEIIDDIAVIVVLADDDYLEWEFPIDKSLEVRKTSIYAKATQWKQYKHMS